MNKVVLNYVYLDYVYIICMERALEKGGVLKGLFSITEVVSCYF